MRKRNCDKWFDNLFWYTLYALPFLSYLFYIISGGGALEEDFYATLHFAEFLDNASFFVNNPVFDALSNALGYGEGVVSLIPQSVVAVCSWFVSVFMVHLCVDFILFIPRLAHKWLKKGYQED